MDLMNLFKFEFCPSLEYIVKAFETITHLMIKKTTKPPQKDLQPSVDCRLLEVCEVLPDMYFLVAEDGTLLDANQKGMTIFGNGKIAPGQVKFSRFISQRFREQFEELLVKSLTSQSGVSMEAELLLTDHDPLNVDLFISSLAQRTDAPQQSCIISARDISDKKRQELDLLRFMNLAHFTVNPIEITDPNGKIIFVNPAFERASGFTKDEVLGKNPNIFSSRKHPANFWQKMWQTISAGKVWVGEVENKRKNGEPFYSQLLISPIINTDKNIEGYFGIHRDLADQKYLEQQLIHAQKMESIGMLAAGLAHEVGNPLASISSLVQIIQRTSDDEFTQDKLELIKSQITRISRIIRDLVDFSRRSTYEVQQTDINKILRDAVEIIRVSKKAKDVIFNIALYEQPPMLTLVPDQIEQVFINLLLNATDALHDNTPHASAPELRKEKIINVSSTLSDDSLFILVEDNGKGIRQEDLAKIFEPFYTTKKVGEGTGLGLWVSYGIIKSFSGEIRVKSKESSGTTFTIRLPIHS
jgi:PAS domain S-box-containing protein